nr:hypothetical protein [Tanacetum cinerariifolium]
GGLSSFKGHANSSFFNMGTPSNFQTPVRSQPGSSDWQRQMPEQSASQYWQPSPQPGSYYSFGQVPSHIGRPNLQTTIETQHDFNGLVDQNIPNRGKRQQLPSKYLVTPFTTQPPTTMMPKQRVSKSKNKGKKANLSPVNLGGVLEGHNEEDNNVTFLGFQFTGNILFYENVDLAKHMNSWMELMIRRRPLNANWTVAYTSTISVHPENNQFIILSDPHVIGTLMVPRVRANRKDVDDIKEQMLKFREEMNARSVRQENTEPINVGQHYGFSDFSQFQSMQGGLSSFNGHANSSFFNMGTSSNFQTPMRSQLGSSDWQRQMPEQSASQYWQPSPQPGFYYSFGQVPSHIGRSNLQTTIETQHDFDGLVDQNIPNRGKRQQLPGKYLVTPFTTQPPTTMVPKQRVSKNKNKGKKANLSPVNLGGVLKKNVDPAKVQRGNYENVLHFLNNPYHIYLDCYMRGYVVPVTFWQELAPHLCMPDTQRLSYGTSIGRLGERRRPLNANWTVAYTSTISVHPENNQFIILSASRH